jgi:hypothetical protein
MSKSKQRQKVAQSHAELERHLASQLKFLASSSRNFDAGDVDEAQRLAVALRILLHTPRQGQALIRQVRLDRVLFLDGAGRVDPAGLLPTTALVMTKFQVGPEGIRSAEYVPRFSAPKLPEPVRWLPFSSWWHQPVIVIPKEAPADPLVITRERLVLYIADQDGGAHVDPQIDAEYHAISREQIASLRLAGSELQLTGPDDSSTPIPHVCAMSLRQIVYEVQRSLSERRTTPPAPTTHNNTGHVR